MKKSGANLLILNLFLSIISLCFLISLTHIQFVSGLTDKELDDLGFTKNQADGLWIKETSKGKIYELTSKQAKDLIAIEGSAGKGISSALTPSHGYFGKIVESLSIEGATQPAGKYSIYDKSTGKIIDLTTQGFEYSISGILQGAGWTIGIYGLVKTVGSMFGTDEAKVDAIAKSAAGGWFVE
jgi:hypothetical protein